MVAPMQHVNIAPLTVAYQLVVQLVLVYAAPPMLPSPVLSPVTTLILPPSPGGTEAPLYVLTLPPRCNHL